MGLMSSKTLMSSYVTVVESEKVGVLNFLLAVLIPAGCEAKTGLSIGERLVSQMASKPPVWLLEIKMAVN